MIELKVFKAKETSTVRLTTYKILIVMEGGVHISLNDQESRVLSKDEFVFLPIGIKLIYKAVGDGSMIIMRFNKDIQECRNFSINTLCQEMEGVSRPEGIYALNVKEKLRPFL